MRIERVAAPGPEWDQFVDGCPGATLAHARAWLEVVHEAYGLEPHGLIARDERGEVCGVLPLVRMRGLRGAAELVSMPFLDTGGPLAKDPATARALVEQALALARELRVGAVDLRAVTPIAGVAATDFAERLDLHLPLLADVEAQWKALPAKVRNQTRKAEREGLRLLDDAADPLAAFYEPFLVNMRDLGSPVHGRRFYQAMARAFGERLRFVVTADGGRPVGGLVAIDHAGVVTVPWASTLRSERARCPNNQIYWEAIRWAIARGARELDFGRSPRDSGTHHFKRGWGALERRLAWTRLSPDGATLAPALPGESTLLRALSRAWQRLPVSVTARLGPPIRRRISS
ncbi:MAG TPA: GNAT family N-acetyltransferase [Myxococcota bacterium]|jgi:FemAB-related protein (PEP-CTERM system-associated)|nr:GNAT family N-acetyltransferase [Myxococcota bacterium]